MTDGTAASSRTTGSSTRRIGAGANSTMKTAHSSANTSPQITAIPLSSAVAYSSGQACSV